MKKLERIIKLLDGYKNKKNTDYKVWVYFEGEHMGQKRYALNSSHDDFIKFINSIDMDEVMNKNNKNEKLSIQDKNDSLWKRKII